MALVYILETPLQQDKVYHLLPACAMNSWPQSLPHHKKVSIQTEEKTRRKTKKAGQLTQEGGGRTSSDACKGSALLPRGESESAPHRVTCAPADCAEKG